MQKVRVGDRVVARRQKWRIVRLEPGERCDLVTLRGIGAQNLNVDRQIVRPFDAVDPIVCRDRVRLVSSARWRRTCRSVLAAAGSASGLRAAAAAKIDLLEHQLEPALAIVSGLASRVLIADEVGLGKTIEAGLVIAELMARGAADRVLLLTPSGLRDQWASELSIRFGLDAAVMDAHEVRRRASELPVDLNPWQTVPLAIGSIDYVKRPEVLPAVLSCQWDVVVVDEAHAAASASDRHDAVSSLCRRALFVLLLTATPHSGNRQTFAALRDLGAVADDQLLIFRRSRREVGLGSGRRIHRLSIILSAAERRMHRALGRLAAAVRAEHIAPSSDAWLALEMLRKRAFSSPDSLARSVARRAAKATDESVQLPLVFDEPDAREDVAPAIGGPLLSDEGVERRLLSALHRSAVDACAADTKLRALDRLLRRLARRREPAIVFTEYRDTLATIGAALGRDAAIVHGGLSRKEILEALDAFRSGRLPLLFATDAASEGLNLHQACRVVINLELPWNPVRLEQRIGRIDRIGQSRRVHVFHLIGRGTGEEVILGRLRERIARAQTDIGSPDPLDSTAASAAGAVDVVDVVDVGGHNPFTPARVREEHARLTRVRSIMASNQGKSLEVPDDDPIVAFTDRSRLRRSYPNSLIAIAEAVLEDSAGGITASQPACFQLCTPGHPQWLRPVIDALVGALTDRATGRIDGELLRWQTESLHSCAAFWKTYAARSAALEKVEAHLSTGLYQAGLFDRRAESIVQASVARQRWRGVEARRRIERAEARGTCVVRRRALLFVVSKSCKGGACR